jgi:UDP-N-acetylglucosamine 2-epimerase (non-hydrolysing)
VGDVMADVLASNKSLAEKRFHIIETLNLESHEYYVATVHRPSNTGNRNAITTIHSTQLKDFGQIRQSKEDVLKLK